MSRFSLRQSRDYFPGLGTVIWIASIVGVIVGFVVYDMNRKESLIRRLIEVGRRRVNERKAIEEVSTEVEEESMDEDAA